MSADPDLLDFSGLVYPTWMRAITGPDSPDPSDELRSSTFAYFGRQPLPNALFNSLADTALRSTMSARRAWDLTLERGIRLALEWRVANPGRPLHLGTPYYVAGMGHVLEGDLDRGFIFMHQALDEDRTITGDPNPDWPAWKFVTMNDASQEQAFLDQVRAYAAFIEARLTSYRESGRGSLSFQALRDRALSQPRLRDVMFHLTFAVARLSKLHAHRQQFPDTDFSRVLTRQLAFDLCQLTDEVLQAWDGTGEWQFYKLGTKYLRAANLHMDQADLDDVRVRFDSSPAGTLSALLDETYVIRRGRPAGASLDLLIAYGLRNHLAHGISRGQPFEGRFDELEPHLLYVLLSAIEHLPWPDTA
jgi:hypothetical protein